jgi:hypothetical protein
MAEDLVILRGGNRDGETTRVQEGVRRIVTASPAPGLLDIYEGNGQTETVAGSGEALVFILAGQEPAEGIAPEMLHSPPADDRPTDDADGGPRH